MNAVQDALERGRALIDGARSLADLRAVEPEAFGKRSELAGHNGDVAGPAAL